MVCLETTMSSIHNEQCYFFIKTFVLMRFAHIITGSYLDFVKIKDVFVRLKIFKVLLFYSAKINEFMFVYAFCTDRDTLNHSKHHLFY